MKTNTRNSKFKDPYCRKAARYCADVLSGKIAACLFVRQACQRQINDLTRWGKSGPFVFDEDKAGRVCRFIEALVHWKGPKAGEHIQLEDWQCFILTTVFGWLNRKTGKRRFRRVYLEEPRGNGKSALSAGVGLYMTGADEESGAEVYSAATTRDQAKIVFDSAKMMLQKNRPLATRLGIDVLTRAIAQTVTGSSFTPLAAEAQSLDGLNVHCALIDELHAHPNRKVYDVLETGAGKRDQSMIWAITTAGTDRAGICYEVRSYLVMILAGQAVDEAMFGCIWTIDLKDDWTDPKIWRKANPNWGVSVEPEFFAQLAQKAQQVTSAQNNFKTKHLNVWCSANVQWMDMAAWDACADPRISLDQFIGEPCWIGLDLASKKDIAAKMRIFKRMIEGKEHYYFFGAYYLPERAVEEAHNSAYKGWVIDGRLIQTSGDVLDFGYVKDGLREDAQRFQVVEVPHDPYQSAQLAQEMMAEGLPMVSFRNHALTFSEPMKELEALALAGRAHHDGDPVLAWMMNNVVCWQDNKENIYPLKERPENKIDGVVAAIMALGRAMLTAPPQPSVYESRGLLEIAV